MPLTAVALRPVPFAMLRGPQCGAPRGVVSRMRMTTTSTCSSDGHPHRPGRGSSNKWSTPYSRKRFQRHVPTVAAATPKRRVTAHDHDGAQRCPFDQVPLAPPASLGVRMSRTCRSVSRGTRPDSLADANVHRRRSGEPSSLSGASRDCRGPLPHPAHFIATCPIDGGSSEAKGEAHPFSSQRLGPQTPPTAVPPEPVNLLGGRRTDSNRPARAPEGDSVLLPLRLQDSSWRGGCAARGPPRNGRSRAVIGGASGYIAR